MLKYIIAGVALFSSLTAFGGTYYFTFNKGVEHGKTQVKAEIFEAQNKALEQAQKDIARGIKELQEQEMRIINAPENQNDHIGDIMRNQLIRMRRGS